MANKKFSAQVESFVLKTQKRIDAVIKASIQDVIDDAQKPVGKGGRMRVDTGFLRASGQISLTGWPSGPIRGDEGKSYEYGTSTITATIAGITAGNTIYFGWTANYAKYREGYDGFLGGAVQKWQQIVDRNVNKLANKIASHGSIKL